MRGTPIEMVSLQGDMYNVNLALRLLYGYSVPGTWYCSSTAVPVNCIAMQLHIYIRNVVASLYDIYAFTVFQMTKVSNDK